MIHLSIASRSLKLKTRLIQTDDITFNYLAIMFMTKVDWLLLDGSQLTRPMTTHLLKLENGLQPTSYDLIS